LAEIGKIKEAILPMLIGMYHVRIEYPDDTKKDEEKPSENGDAEKDSEVTPIEAESIHGHDA